jgi:hypothetical protein
LVKTYTLTTIEQAVLVAKTLRKSWFRGHNTICNELTPAIFRDDYKTISFFRPDIETFFIDAFRRGAPVLEKNLPEWGDYIGWLFLMQHHGAPTRLLDWTENALIALYFAVSGGNYEDGELWAMYPNELNRLSKIDGIPILDSPVVQYLAEEPMLNDDGKRTLASNLLGMTKGPDYPIAIQPTMNFPRMISQFSVFTIHPEPCTGGKITELLIDEKHLVRYIIPKEYKASILENLPSLGITRGALYQDLDSLCVDLKQEARVCAYSPPEPPTCNGNYDA